MVSESQQLSHSQDLSQSRQISRHPLQLAQLLLCTATPGHEAAAVRVGVGGEGVLRAFESAPFETRQDTDGKDGEAEDGRVIVGVCDQQEGQWTRRSD